ncbi:hypothetical protein BDQ17DRAFT_1344895 [Cyathus striatus]|nr:hypothetical protein BDQ17DRAFT_1344895 [Cyathus striatus]
MTDPSKVVYAASCNPPRRAKRARLDPSPTSPALSTSSLSGLEPETKPTQPRPILPKKTATNPKPTPIMDPSNHHHDANTAVPPPAKRGRKPGPLSRSAREAQRRLNHSIIEKARRTKINDALATLKQLVPADYGQIKKSTNEAEESDDGEFRESSSKAGKPGGKREEKEKEFKLEILVRTVSYMQDLLQHVAVLENAVNTCSNCSAKHTNKRKRSASDCDEEGESHDSRATARPRKTSDARGMIKSCDTNGNAPIAPLEPQKPSTPLPTPPESRLPPISSWLPNSAIDPSLLPSKASSSSPSPPNQLPSPPSSTHFDPIRSSNIPPTLNLGPVATASMLPSTRTPEDESAASLLLQISASSPTTRPVGSSPHHLLEPSMFALSSSAKHHASGKNVETPGSLLGVGHPHFSRNKLSLRR